MERLVPLMGVAIFLLSYGLANDFKLDKGVVFLKKKDVLFSGSSWSIIVDINITEYDESLNLFMDAVQQIRTLNTNSTQESFHDVSTVLTQINDKESLILIEQARKLKTKMKSLLHTVCPIERRPKRALMDVGGTALKWLFGTLDSDNLEEINNRMQNIDTHVSGITHLLQKQITYINQSVQIGNRNTQSIVDMSKILSTMNEKLNGIETQIALTIKEITYVVSLSVHLQSLYRSMQLTLMSLEEEMNQFQTALMDLSQNKISEYFMSPIALSYLLTHIEPLLTQEFSLLTPITLEDMYVYYNSLASVSVASIGDIMRLFVHIPIKSHNTFFNLYEALPLPFQLHNHSASFIIQPENKFLAITPNNELYTEINDINTVCKTGWITICKPMRKIQRAKGKSCLKSLFTGDTNNVQKFCKIELLLNPEPIFYRPENSHTWIYSVLEPETIVTHCPVKLGENDNIVKSQIIQGTGSLQINPDCQILSDNYILLPHSTGVIATHKRMDIHIPPVENIIYMIVNNSHNANNDIGSHDEIETVLSNIRKTSNGHLRVPLVDWMEQIKLLKLSPWYKMKNSSYIHLSYSVTLALVFIILICNRKRIWAKITICKRGTVESRTRSISEARPTMRVFDQNITYPTVSYTPTAGNIQDTCLIQNVLPQKTVSYPPEYTHKQIYPVFDSSLN